MKKIIIATLLIIGVTKIASAQTDLSFYHFGAETPNSSLYNPAFFPDANFYMSLPAISGINVGLSSPFSYGNAYGKSNNGGKDLFNKNLYQELAENDVVSYEGFVSLLQLGIRINQKTTFTLFANERFQGGSSVPVYAITIPMGGNVDFIGDLLQDDIYANTILYREVGIGLTKELEISNMPIQFGLRLKMLQGDAYVGNETSATGNYLTDQDGNATIQLQNARFQTAGLGVVEKFNDGSFSDIQNYVVNNGNNGFAFDFGANMEVNEKLSVSFAMNDIGSITWTDDVENYTFEDKEVDFVINIFDADNISENIESQFDKFEHTEDNESFTTSLGTRTFLSARYQLIKNGAVHGTVLRQQRLGKGRMSYGLGYTHRLGRSFAITSTLSGSKLYGFTVGAGLSWRVLGFMQMYSSIDNFAIYNDAQARNVNRVTTNFGINFMFGRKKKRIPKTTSRVIGAELLKSEFLTDADTAAVVEPVDSTATTPVEPVVESTEVTETPADAETKEVQVEAEEAVHEDESSIKEEDASAEAIKPEEAVEPVAEE